jgi:hypothetical protein
MAASSCLRVSGGVPASAESGRTAQAGIDAENETEPADDSTLRDELPALALRFGHLPGWAARFIDQRSCRWVRFCNCANSLGALFACNFMSPKLLVRRV